MRGGDARRGRAAGDGQDAYRGTAARGQGRRGVATSTRTDFERLREFTATVAQAGCAHFIVHARKAVLGGLSPRENREVPPLRFDVVQRLKQEFPQLWIGVNGGLRTVAHSEDALRWSDGVMLGREAYHRPAVLAELHAALFDDGWQTPDADSLLERMAAYAEREVAAGERPASITRHMLGLLQGRPGARRYRQCLSEGARALGLGGAAARAVGAAAARGSSCCRQPSARCRRIILQWRQFNVLPPMRGSSLV